MSLKALTSQIDHMENFTQSDCTRGSKGAQENAKRH